MVIDVAADMKRKYDMYSPCKQKLIDIATEIKGCFDNVVEFWNYMQDLEKIDCNKLLNNEYERPC